MISEEQLEELQKLADAASPGPWYSLNEEEPNVVFAYDGGNNCWEVASHVEFPDQAFICAAREAVPELIARVRELESDNACLRKQVQWYMEHAPFYADASTENEAGDMLVDAIDQRVRAEHRLHALAKQCQRLDEWHRPPEYWERLAGRLVQGEED